MDNEKTIQPYLLQTRNRPRLRLLRLRRRDRARPCDGCFKLHETPWLEGYPVNEPTDIVEVRFKNTRRSFYQNVNNLPLKVGDIVAWRRRPARHRHRLDDGRLVARQMRRTGFNPYNGEYRKIYRKAKPYDIERWQEPSPSSTRR